MRTSGFEVQGLGLRLYIYIYIYIYIDRGFIGFRAFMVEGLGFRVFRVCGHLFAIGYQPS